MRLDVLIPTFRRPQLLVAALDSIAAAATRTKLAIRVIIVDNDAETDLSDLRAYLAAWPLPVVLVQEPRAGKSTALNTGLRLCTAEYVAFIDDDEVMDGSWFEVTEAVLAAGKWDFVGGRSLPLWLAPPPEWLPRSAPAVLGIVDSGPRREEYAPSFPGMLTGGNAIVRRSVLLQLGGFTAELGPSRAHRLLSGEDEDLYRRLLDSGARGLYVPELVVHHYIHRDRLQKRYYRAWFFWNGTAKGMLAKHRREPVPHLLGAPRYLYGAAARACIDLMHRVVTGDAKTLDDEAALWLLAGFLHGRYFHQQRAAGPLPPPRVAVVKETADVI